MRIPRTIPVLLGISMLAFAPAVWAVGGSSESSGSSSTTTVADADYNEAVNKVNAKQYAAAIVLLKNVVAKDPKNADAFNYLGYSSRQLDNDEEAFAYYYRALEINPRHRGATAYLGQLYLKKGQLDKAEEQASKLSGLCSFGCDELSELRASIKTFKDKKS